MFSQSVFSLLPADMRVEVVEKLGLDFDAIAALCRTHKSAHDAVQYVFKAKMASEYPDQAEKLNSLPNINYFSEYTKAFTADYANLTKEQAALFRRVKLNNFTLQLTDDELSLRDGKGVSLFDHIVKKSGLSYDRFYQENKDSQQFANITPYRLAIRCHQSDQVINGLLSSPSREDYKNILELAIMHRHDALVPSYINQVNRDLDWFYLFSLKCGNVNTATQFLNQGANRKAFGLNRENALHMAIASGNFDAITFVNQNSPSLSREYPRQYIDAICRNLQKFPQDKRLEVLKIVLRKKLNDKQLYMLMKVSYLHLNGKDKQKAFEKLGKLAKSKELRVLIKSLRHFERAINKIKNNPDGKLALKNVHDAMERAICLNNPTVIKGYIYVARKFTHFAREVAKDKIHTVEELAELNAKLGEKLSKHPVDNQTRRVIFKTVGFFAVAGIVFGAALTVATLGLASPVLALIAGASILFTGSIGSSIGGGINAKIFKSEKKHFALFQSPAAEVVSAITPKISRKP